MTRSRTGSRWPDANSEADAEEIKEKHKEIQDIRAFAKVYSEAMMFIRQEVLILMVGLEADENTTIPYKMKLREYVTTTPTVGFNVETVEYENIDVTVRDVVGQDQIRPPWRHYSQNVQGFADDIKLGELFRHTGETLRARELAAKCAGEGDPCDSA